MKPTNPDWLFAPRDDVTDDLRTEFENGLRMPELMPGALGPNGKPQSGLATMHDGFALSFTFDEVEDKIDRFLATTNREQAKAIFGTLCNPQQWDYAAAKRILKGSEWRRKISRIYFSPFDMRYTVYDKSVAVHLRRRLSDHFFNHQNFGLVLGEAGQEISGEDWDAVCCVDSILQLNYFRRNGSPTLPLYLYDEGLLEDNTVGRRANLSSAHLRQFADSLKLEIGKDGLPAGVRPEDIFHYAYAVFHSPGYRRRYAQFLMTEFPRLPLTRHLEMFHSLVRFGSELVGLHLLKSIKPSYASARFVGSRNPEIEKVSWLSNAVWIDKAQTVGFVGVNEAVWKFHIGGYRVCEKWLNDRRGRPLTKDDITHYQKIIFALTETIRLMGQVDEVIEAHGGWPGAFQSIGVADTATLGIEATTQAQ